MEFMSAEEIIVNSVIYKISCHKQAISWIGNVCFNAFAGNIKCLCVIPPSKNRLKGSVSQGFWRSVFLCFRFLNVCGLLFLEAIVVQLLILYSVNISLVVTAFS